jgi:putative ABC transport system permease protein
MRGIVRDVRYALRGLARSPGFAAIAIATLALGIGANTAMFSIVNAVLFRPLPFPHSDRLVRITSEFEGNGVGDAGLSTPELADYRDRAGVFEELCGIFPINANLTETDQPERVEALIADSNYFALLGVSAARGRVFGPADVVPGIAQVAVITDGLWKRRYGSDPAVIGRSLRLDEDPYTIIGVLPPGFRHPGRGLSGDAELFVTAGWKSAPFPSPPQRRGYFLAGALARLKPGVSVETARARVESLGRAFRAEDPKDYPVAERWKPRVLALREDLAGSSRQALVVLFGAVGLVLLIACANVANLLLARASVREREIAIRRALGAARGRLVRQLLTESVLLACAGAALAVGLCASVLEALTRVAPEAVRTAGIRVDTPVLAFTATLAIGAGIVFGLAPALQLSGPDLSASLGEAARGASGSAGRTRLRSSLVVAEFAIALVLLIGATLLIRSLERLSRVDPGFDPSRVLTARLWLPQPNEPSAGPYFKHEARAGAYRKILDRLETLPGVESAGAVNRLPLSGLPGFGTYSIEGAEGDLGSRSAIFSQASPGYFRALRIRLLQGRLFEPSDDERSAPVAVVSESLARREFPAGAIGRRVRTGGAASQDPWLTIVGVVGDVRSDALDTSPRPQLYRCLYQSSNLGAALVLRGKSDPATMGSALAREVRAVDPNLPVFGVRTMEEILGAALADRKFAMTVLAIFAGLALVLSAIGVYGVMAYATEQRSREIGIRVALGAAPGDVLSLVLRQGMRLTLSGVAVGLLASLAATRGLRALLFDVSARDPAVFASIALLLSIVALAACALPARRAARLDPIAALRQD